MGEICDPAWNRIPILGSPTSYPPVATRSSYCKLSEGFTLKCGVKSFGSTQRTCANVAFTSGHRDCVTVLKINEDSRIIGMAFKFTLPATHACHYLALAVGIFAGLLTMVATRVQVITPYPGQYF